MSQRAKIPCRSTPEAAGYDLYAAETKIIPKGSRDLISTDLLMQIPTGHYDQIAPRSGLSLNSCIDIAGGVIDQNFRGIVASILVNNGTQDFLVETGDRIAQLVLIKIITPHVEEVTSMKIDDSSRTKGFGSSGMH